MYAFAERQVKRLVREMKRSYIQTMKMEVAPWIADDLIDIDFLYTDLTLERVYNELVRPKSNLSDYKEIFVDSDSNGRRVLPCLTSEAEGDRFLLTGDPGMGKTTLTKMIAFDWARESFKKFSMIFLVPLKLVNPGESIERAIIQQTPVLESSGLEEGQLRNILEKYVNRCLLILDGLDENAIDDRVNDDVIKIIRKRRLPRCHVFVTSRPHSTKSLEIVFKKIVRVNGFSPEKAKEFASKILKNSTLENQVLAFNPGNFADKRTLCSCPILLSFICSLAKEGKIDLSNDDINIGEVYTKMMHSLYQKFKIRHEQDGGFLPFQRVIAKVGKIALQTLLSGKNTQKKSEIDEEVGAYAFHYGLMIGDKNSNKLRGTSTADINVSFAHQSMKEYLGAFHFIQELDEMEEKDMKSLQGDHAEPIFMRNPLFLHFCLWFLYKSEKQEREERHFEFQNIESVRDTMQNYFVKQIDVTTLVAEEVAKKFHVMNLEEIHEKQDELRLQFFQDILSKCSKVKVLQFENKNLLDWVLKSMRPVLPSMTCITVKDCFVMSRDHDLITIDRDYDPDTDISVDRSHKEKLESCEARNAISILGNYVGDLGEKLSLHTNTFTNEDTLTLLSQLNHTYVHEVRVCGKYCEGKPNSIERKTLPLFEHLKHLSFAFIEFDKNNISSLSDASQRKMLPCLTHLKFIHCTGLQSSLALLFRSPWRQLTHVGFHHCILDISDMKVIGNVQNDCFPRLASLGLSFSKYGIISGGIMQKVPSMEHLKERFDSLKSLNLEAPNVDKTMNWKPTSNLKELRLVENSREGQNLFPAEKLPPSAESLALHGCIDRLDTLTDKLSRNNLRLLDISFSRNVRGSLSVLFAFKYPFLKTLILCDCELNSQDLCSLAESIGNHKLPDLKHLDISANDIDTNEAMTALFGFSCTWNQLISLNIMNTGFSHNELHKKVESGCLSSLQELRISEYPLQPVEVNWPHLQTLGIKNPNDSMLSNIADAKEKENFPSLNSVCLEFSWYEAGPYLHTYKAFCRLTETNVSCHRSNVKEFTSVELTCTRKYSQYT